jgi:Putative redox-active protein (C_GCAxxG_C_C)
LKEKVGYPWTTMPEYMFAHAAAGYGGHGTLCGVLGVCSALINMVVFDKDETYRMMIDRMMDGYARMEFPTDRFDDISSIPKQVKTRAMSPLCHTSVSKWSLAAGTQVNSKQKKERCAKVTGEVVYIVVDYLNQYFEGTWKPSPWTPKEEIAHCWKCHGSDDMWHNKAGMNDQQGHMDCLLCHTDHTKK